MERYTFFRQLGKAVYQIDSAYDVFSKGARIKPNMLWLLSALNDGKAHTQSQICWDWNFPRTTVNTLVKELEKSGHVTLRPVPGARRELYVELTPSGKAYADEILQPVYEAEERLFRRYFAEHDTEFVEDLHRFALIMKQYFLTGDYDEREEETK